MVGEEECRRGWDGIMREPKDGREKNQEMASREAKKLFEIARFFFSYSPQPTPFVLQNTSNQEREIQRLSTQQKSQSTPGGPPSSSPSSSAPPPLLLLLFLLLPRRAPAAPSPSTPLGGGGGRGEGGGEGPGCQRQ